MTGSAGKNGLRIACLDLPALPLQLLSRAHPEWADAPLAVVQEDHPHAKIEWVDRAARAQRVQVGMRYAAALQLAPSLRAAPVDARALADAEAEILDALQTRSPRVEPDATRSGVFWIDPSGLGNLFGPLERWARNVRSCLSTLGLDGTVTVGFARLPTWAVARSHTGRCPGGVFVIESPAEETTLAGRAPLGRLEIAAELRDALAALGIETLEGFTSLPRGEVGVRFGPAARELHAHFSDDARRPMQPAPFEAPIVVSAELDPPDDDAHRLLFCIKGAMHALMAELAQRSLALSALVLTLTLEGAAPRTTRIELAQASRDVLSVLELVRLRLANVVLSARVEQLQLEAEPSRLDGAQLALFAGRRRDPKAAARSISRLRAAFGDEAVTRAELRDAWLPENTFAWRPTDRVDPPSDVGEPEVGVFVRRLKPRPTPLPSGAGGRPRLDPPITALTGPYRMQGGWWVREAARDYYFAELADGALLWLYRDRRRGRWFLHGHVD